MGEGIVERFVDGPRGTCHLQEFRVCCESAITASKRFAAMCKGVRSWV
jgi:hypothetical protein